MGNTATILKPPMVSMDSSAPEKTVMPTPQGIMAALSPYKRTEGNPIGNTALDTGVAGNAETGILPVTWTGNISAPTRALSGMAAAVPAITAAQLLNLAEAAYHESAVLASDYISFAFSTGHPYLVVADTVASAYLLCHYRTKALLPVAAVNLVAAVADTLAPIPFSEAINASETLAWEYLNFAFSDGIPRGVMVLAGTMVAAYAAYYGLAAWYGKRQKEKQPDHSAEKKS